jgi:hypothetical protein
MKIKKKCWILCGFAFLLLSVAFFSYLSRINIIGNVRICISKPAYSVDSILVKGISPLGREFEFPYNKLTNQWAIDNLQLNKIVFLFPVNYFNDTSLFILIDGQRFDNKELRQLKIFQSTRSENNKIALVYKPEKSSYLTLLMGFFAMHWNFLLMSLLIIIVFFLRKKSWLGLINNFLLGAIIISGFFWLFFASFYCFPNAEDFLVSLPAMIKGVFAGTIELSNADGRYFTNFLYSINPLVFGWIDGYRILPSINILMIIIALGLFIKIVFNKFLSNISLSVFVLLFVLIHFAMVPSLVHDLYWMASSFAYLFFWVFSFLWISVIILFIRENKKSYSFLWFFLGALLLFCTTGIHEMILVFNSLLLFGSVLYVFFLKRPEKNKILLVMTFWLICLILFFLSPGSVSRFGRVEGGARDFFFFTGIIVSSAKDFFYTLYHFLFSNIIVIPSIVFFSIFLAQKLKLNLNQEKQLVKYSILSVVILMPVFYLMTSAYYIPLGFDKGYPERIYNIVQFGMQLITFISLPIIISLTAKKIILNHFSFFSFIRTAALAVIFSGLLWGNSNISLIRKEYYLGTFIYFKDQMAMRYKIINNAALKKNNKIAIIDSLKLAPKSIYHPTDISPNRNPEKWNVAYEKYFKVDKIMFSTDTVIMNKETLNK